MSRAVPLWIGASDDTPIPPRVKLRVFEAHNGRCHWTGRKIKPGDQYDFDHIIALCNGGTNSEDNLAPILRGKAHKEKTARDVAEKSKIARIKAKHLGLIKPKGMIQSRGFQKQWLWPVGQNREGD
jgi:5-methylcytosine-specific restriction endonuclease McrA